MLPNHSAKKLGIVDDFFAMMRKVQAILKVYLLVNKDLGHFPSQGLHTCKEQSPAILLLIIITAKMNTRTQSQTFCAEPVKIEAKVKVRKATQYSPGTLH